jgi:thiamine-phosphate pyrophosphorylase
LIPDKLAVVAITDPRASIGMLAAAEAALRAGVGALQLRWKDAVARDLLALADALRSRTREAGALLLVNDRVDVALAAGADGAHLGDDDLPLSVARRITPPGFILGRSVDNPDEAERAENEGADYVGLGPIFRTASKGDAPPPIGVEGVAAVRRRVHIPIVAIGGIEIGNAAALIGAGAAGVAVIAAIMSSDDPEGAARRLLGEVQRSGGVR